jgi:NifU-like protein
MWEYTDKVMQYFLNPLNVGTIEDADAIGEVGSLACGDALRLYIKFDGNERIQDAKFQTFGCASAIASSSVLTEMLKGMSIEDAERLTNKEIVDALGGLPEAKMHCSVMGQEVLEDALRNYRGLGPALVVDGKIVCRCFGVSDSQIKRAVTENGLVTVEAVTNFTKAGGGCKKCHERIQEVITDTLATSVQGGAKATELNDKERFQLVDTVVDSEIRLTLNKDGYDVELVDVKGWDVFLNFIGEDLDEHSSWCSVRDIVEKRLRQSVSEEIAVWEA